MRILSYNIQATINSCSYLSYSYQWHRQFLPDRSKYRTLERIAEFINHFDIVCLQEIELGGLRNGFKSQREQFLALCDFPYDLVQINRRISRFSLHGNLILSRLPIQEILNTSLPGKFRGRGVLAGSVTINEKPLIIANAHLSLGSIDQHLQLNFIRSQLTSHENVLICGDMNCQSHSPPLHTLTDHGYQLLGEGSPTFPSWKPRKALDHALLKGSFVAKSTVCNHTDSDHLPIMIEILTST